ncbi:TPA: hypothetical protein N2P93_001039 [Klebsiella pneumoniae]|nr:hypothetical protein [Klebsiella pneumoniae]
MNISTVNELIASLETAGELSIREQKFLKLAKAFKQVAGENVALKAVFSQKEIPSEAVDAFMKTAVMDHDWNETSEWSWVENETEVIHAVLDALKPETPATDRIVAGIKADGDKAAGDYLKLEAQHMPVVERLMMQDAAEICYGTAARLREGAK